MVWYPDRISYRQAKDMHPSASKDLVYTTPSEIILPDGLHRFFVEGRKNTWLSDDTSNQVPGRIGFNRYEYRRPGAEVVYEDEYFDGDEVPGVFFGTELVKKEGRGTHIVASYNYTGELTEEGMEVGEETVYGMLKYFLRDHIDKARFGNTFEVGHRERGKWSYITIGARGRSVWGDKEYIKYKGDVVYALTGSGAIFL